MLLYLGNFGLVLYIILLLARVLGSGGFGGFVFLLTIFLFLSTLNLIGLNGILFQEMSTRPHARASIFRNGLALRLLTGVVSIGIAVGIFLVASPADIPRWVTLVSASVLLFSTSLSSVSLILRLPSQIDSQDNLIEVIATCKRLSQIIAICVGIFIVYHGVPTMANLLPLFVPLGVAHVLIIVTAGEFLEMGALVFVNYRRGGSLKPRWDAHTVGYLFRQAKPLAILGGLTIILFRANILILSLYLPMSEVGLFALPMLLAESALIFPIMYAMSVSKTFSVVYRNQSVEFLRLARLSFHLLALIASPIICLIWMFSGNIIITLAGQIYIPSAQVLTVLTWNQFLLFGGVLFGALLLEIGEKKTLGSILGWGVLLNLVLNLLIIPTFGIIGAAWVSFISTFFVLIVSLFHQNTRELARIWVISLPLPVLGILLINLFARGLHLEFFPATIFTVLFFFGWVVLTRYFTQEDLQQVHRLLKR